MDFVSFEMRVQAALGAALSVDMEARLYEATMHSDYENVHCVFGGKDNSTIQVNVDKDGNAGKPSIISWPWLEDEPVDWYSQMTYNEARTLFDQKFPRTAWSTVVYRKPLTYPAVNSEFIFTVGGGYVVVDTITGEVYKLPR
jgi:hypothetical protein